MHYLLIRLVEEGGSLTAVNFCLGEGADLVPGDGFLLQQGGGELGEGVPVAGEQVPGAGFGVGQEGGDFLVDQPLGVLGVTACSRPARDSLPAGRCS